MNDEILNEPYFKEGLEVRHPLIRTYLINRPLSLGRKYFTDPNGLMNAEERALLNDIGKEFCKKLEKFIFKSGTVEISKDCPYIIPKIEITKEEIDRVIEEIVRRLKKVKGDDNYLQKLLDIYQSALAKGPNSNGKYTIVFPPYKILGEYIRKFPNDEPKIYIYKNNIGDDINLLAETYVHELYHLYYDVYHGLDKEPVYEACLEEPLVECAMLRFMEAYDKKMYDHALWNVKNKQKSVSICFYSFGAYLAENTQNKDWPELYSKASFPLKPDLLDIYKSHWKYHLYPEDEKKVADDLHCLLTYD